MSAIPVQAQEGTYNEIRFRQTKAKSQFFRCATTCIPGKSDEDKHCVHISAEDNLAFGIFDGKLEFSQRLLVALG